MTATMLETDLAEGTRRMGRPRKRPTTSVRIDKDTGDLAHKIADNFDMSVADLIDPFLRDALELLRKDAADIVLGKKPPLTPETFQQLVLKSLQSTIDRAQKRQAKGT
jgi:hypothetical protein